MREADAQTRIEKGRLIFCNPTASPLKQEIAADIGREERLKSMLKLSFLNLKSVRTWTGMVLPTG